MLIRKQKILSESQLRKLSEHKYAVSSSSLIEPYLQVSCKLKKNGYLSMNKAMSFKNKLTRLREVTNVNLKFNFLPIALLELACG